MSTDGSGRETKDGSTPTVACTLPADIKEIINRGGQKISPREIDELIGAHPAVAQAVAFGVPDSRLGEDIAAAVVLKAGDSITEHGLRGFIADRAADYKVPRQIYFVDKIPAGPTGKIQRLKLPEQLGIADGGGSISYAPAVYVAPQSPTERMLAHIWRSVLRVDRVGINDHFLALGGDSLLLAQVTSRLRQAGGEIQDAKLAVRASVGNPGRQAGAS